MSFVFEFKHALSFIGEFFFNKYIFTANMYDSLQRYNIPHTRKQKLNANNKFFLMAI